MVVRWVHEPASRCTQPDQRQVRHHRISVVVPWELAMKTRLGQLDASVLLTRWMEIVELQGFSELAVGSDHAIRAGLLPLHHRDPFDRLLVAQAQATGWPIISGDRVFDQYGVRRTW